MSKEQLNEMKKFMQIAEDPGEFIDDKLRSGEIDVDDVDFGPDCSYCDDLEPLDRIPCLNCGSKQHIDTMYEGDIEEDFDTEKYFPGRPPEDVIDPELSPSSSIESWSKASTKSILEHLNEYRFKLENGSVRFSEREMNKIAAEIKIMEYELTSRGVDPAEADTIFESDPDDTDWDAHWAREDGDDERADDLEADAEFARYDAEDDLDEDPETHRQAKDAFGRANKANASGNSEEGQRLMNKGNKLAKQAARTDEEEGETCIRCRKGTMELGDTMMGPAKQCNRCNYQVQVNEDLDPDGMGNYNVTVETDNTSYPDEVETAIPYDEAVAAAEAIVDKHFRFRAERVEQWQRGEGVEWSGLDRNGDSFIVKVEPTDDADAEAWHGESISLSAAVNEALNPQTETVVQETETNSNLPSGLEIVDEEGDPDADEDGDGFIDDEDIEKEVPEIFPGTRDMLRKLSINVDLDD